MFKNIKGNERIKEQLVNSIKLNKTSHSYMFIGTEGIGKKMIAKEFAKMLLCTNENKTSEQSQYCNKCKSCIEFDSNNNPDFEIISPDGNSLKIEQIRNMQAKVSEKPIVSEKKVYIIDDSDKMTQEAQNCLLKTLEEPPEFVTIILIGSNESAYLTTIKSRCMILHFEDIPNTFQGSIGKALKLEENKELFDKIEKLINNIETRDKIDFLNSSEVIKSAKDEKFDVLDYMNAIFIKLAINNNKYANCIKIVENTKKRLQSNANYDMSIDNMILNIWEQIN